MRCCDQDRPHDTLPLVVLSTKQLFVIVHDYVTQVHAWLQELEGRYIACLGRTLSRIYRDGFLLMSPERLELLRVLS